MKHVFGVVKGSELVNLVKVIDEVRVVPLDEDEPVMIIVNKDNLDEVSENALYLVLMKVHKLSELISPKPIEVAQESPKLEEKKKEKKDLIDEIYEKMKWNISEIAQKLPFEIIDFIKERDEDLGIWVFKFRLEKKKSISVSPQGAAKMLLHHVLSVLKEEKFVEPLLLAISMEGKVIYLIADVVMDEMIRAVIASVGLVLKDYVAMVDVANNLAEVMVLAEKSPEAKVGLFSGYKVAEEIAKIVKERLKRKVRVRVKLKVGLFDYVKIL